MFTKETLPIGSKIVVESGWQYRPEGWIDGASNAESDRPVNVSTAEVVIDEEWWGSWTQRAFNISKTDTSDISSLTEDDILAVFKIYIPKTTT